MIRRMAVVLLLAIVLAGCTWIVGWWSVPVVAAIVGMRERRAWPATVASVLAWSALLAIDAASNRLGALATSIGGVIGIPAVGALIVTLVFVALLSASAATLGALLGAAVMSARNRVVS